MSIELQPLVGKQQLAVKLCTGRINIFEGSVRSSKTVCSLLAWLLFTRTGPAGNLVMVGKTERTLKRNVIDPLVDMIGPKRCRYSLGSGELWLLGRRIYVAGANDERAQDKIRGLTLAGAYVDEATVIPESFWAMLLTRMSVEGARVCATTNPDGPNHWLMRDYLRRAATWVRHDGEVVHDDSPRAQALGLHRFSFRLVDNPSLSEAYVESQRAAFTGLWYLRFIEGQWVMAEGAIYDTFDPSPGAGHVVDQVPARRIDRWVVALDYGTTNPFVALLIGLGFDVDGTERMWICDEYRWDSRAERRQRTDAEYSVEMRRWLAGAWGRLGLDPESPPEIERVIVDPSAASFKAQLWRDGWEHVRDADNAVADGIRSVATLLAADRLRIHERCRGLIEEKAGYVWDSKASDKGEDRPLKEADHGPDAERYGVMGTRRWWRHWVTVDPLADVDAA